MRHTIIFLFGFIFVSFCNSQELFIKDYSTRSLVDNQRINDYLNTIFCEDYHCGSIDISVLSSDKIYVTIPDKDVRVEYKLIEKNNEKWIGKTRNGEGTLIAIVNGAHAIATVTFNGNVYQICSLDNNLSILAKLDQSYLAEESSCGTPNIANSTYSNANESKNGMGLYPLRVLVAYTPAAARFAFPDIITRTKLAMEEMNQSYINSLIPIRAELAGCVFVDYKEIQSESGYEIDRDRFSGKNDGYMDEIHALRDNYSADVCVLIEDVYREGLAGIAQTIYANESTAFCLVSYKYMVGYFSFAHEIGHLQGARHDTYVDSSSSPFAYGHGYVSPFGNWRTIMGYGNACNGCERVLYWSNPNVMYPEDNLPMGTTNKENNARVLDETFSYISDFRPTPDRLVLSNNTVKNAEYVYWMSANTIENAGSLIVNPGAEVKMKSPGYIKLSPGFHAKQGSKLIINNGDIHSQFYDAKNEQRIDLNFEEKTIIESTTGANYLNLKQYDPIDKINIYNLNGIEIQEIIPHNGEMHLPKLPSGIYLIKIHTLGKIEVKKVFIE